MIRRFIDWLMLRRGQKTIQSVYDRAEERPATQDGEPPKRKPRGRVD